MKKALFARLAVVGAGVGSMVAVPAHAALDAAVTTAITAAQTDLLALFAALTTAGAAIWVARLIYKRFSVR
ncbi:MAG: major capsid protein [Rhodoferax sp.]|uniref:major capsid protein n=1 Tax=Rhodoferax sp. TaxID=50421 RepID=UPI002717C6DF|nr:major capsid protein [Rhodoferax sp.]MDO8447542.1 major capsid protein [Rhodoferax sp.]